MSAHVDNKFIVMPKRGATCNLFDDESINQYFIENNPEIIGKTLGLELRKLLNRFSSKQLIVWHGKWMGALKTSEMKVREYYLSSLVNMIIKQQTRSIK